MIELKLNKYIEVAMELYENVVINPETHLIIKERSKKFPFKMIEKKTTPVIDHTMEKIKRLAEDTIVSSGMKFNDLWEFCQFVKFAEKIIFYVNDPKKQFYVDSNIDDLSKRQFVITDFYNTYQLLFKLEKAENSVNNDILKVIRLSISRNYGRKMVNEFVIVNSSVKYNDESDMFLIEEVNKILYKNLNTVFWNIINMIKENKHC